MKRQTGEASKKRVGRNVKVNGYSNKVRLETKARKRAEAEVRDAKWRALTPQQQLEYLNTYHPNGAKRQRARLAKLLNPVI